MNILAVIPVFAIILFLAVSVNTIPNVFAETLTDTTNENSLDVKIEIDDDARPGDKTKLKIEFLTPNTEKIQVHIDYTVNIKNNGDSIFGPIPLTHTSTGSISIPVTLEDGTNKVTVAVEGILFVPIPQETATFDVVLGQPSQDKAVTETSSKVPAWIKNNAEWWANDLIEDATFVSGIQFLIQEGIISVSPSPSSSESSSSSDSKSNEIPKWIKNNADWWSQEMISDDDFLTGIEFLVENGIISVTAQISEPQPLKIGDVDLSQASPVLGSADASVTIIEFGDYQCPNCKKWFLNTKPDIVANYIETGKANLYFVDLAFLGDDSLPASAATYCAGDQGLYWQYHSYLYSNQRGIDSGWASASSLHNYADVLGLDATTFAKCMDSGKYDKAVVFNLEEAIKNGAEASPFFVIVGPDGQKESINGPQPYPVFESTVNSMLES